MELLERGTHSGAGYGATIACGYAATMNVVLTAGTLLPGPYNPEAALDEDQLMPQDKREPPAPTPAESNAFL
eukprot:3710953-Rhodomonas_salina.1